MVAITVRRYLRHVNSQATVVERFIILSSPLSATRFTFLERCLPSQFAPGKTSYFLIWSILVEVSVSSNDAAACRAGLHVVHRNLHY